jgi:hypothetical protein
VFFPIVTTLFEKLRNTIPNLMAAPTTAVNAIKRRKAYVISPALLALSLFTLSTVEVSK